MLNVLDKASQVFESDPKQGYLLLHIEAGRVLCQLWSATHLPPGRFIDKFQTLTRNKIQ